MATVTQPSYAPARQARRVHRPEHRPLPLQSTVRAVRPSGDDAAFMEELGARQLQSRHWLTALGGRVLRVGPRAGRVLSVLLLALGACVFTTVGTSDQAQAIPFLGEYCADWRVEQNKDNARSGIVAFGDTTDENGKLPNTTWGQYGLAGINWDVFWAECGSFGTWLMGGISDMTLAIPMSLSAMTITFFQWVFEGHILNTFLEPRTTGKTARAPLDVIVDALQAQLFLQFFGLMTIIGALVLFWRGIIKGAGLADTLSKVLVMILVGAAAAFFGANAAWIVKGFNDTTNDVTGVAFAAFSQATCRVAVGEDNADRCGKGPGADENSSAVVVACVDSQTDGNGIPKTVYVRSVDCIGQVMYHALIFTPWAMGELGPLNTEARDASKPETGKAFTNDYGNRIALALKILHWQAYSRSEVDLIESGEGAVDTNTGLITNSGNGTKVQKGNYLGERKGDWNCFTKHPKSSAFEILMKDFSNGSNKLKDRIWQLYEEKRDDTDKTPESNADDVLFNACEIAHMGYEEGTWWKLDLDEGERPATSWRALFDHVEKKEQFRYFSGANVMHRFQTALLALITGLVMSFVITTIAIAYLVLQIATVMFAMLAPIAFLIGLIPVFGLRIFLKWAELFLGTFLRRLGLGIFVGFLMTLYTMVLNIPFQWYMQFGTLVGIALVGIVYRKKLMEIAGMGGVTKYLQQKKEERQERGEEHPAWRATKGSAKFGKNRVKGARLAVARGRATYNELGDKKRGGQGGSRVGKPRRLLAAVWSGAAGGGRRHQGRMERQAGRSLGASNAQRGARKDGHVRRR